MQDQFTQSQNDSQGQNRISLFPTKRPSVFNVELHLQFKTVYPGKLDLSGEGCFRSNRKPEHIFQKLHAWGVNAEVIDRYEFKWISILCDGREYITNKQYLIHFGRRFTYQNCEQQYFLPIEMWGVDAVKEFEKQEAKKQQQLSIFPLIEAA